MRGDEVARKVIQSEVNQIEQIANLGADEFCGVTQSTVMLHIFLFGHYEHLRGSSLIYMVTGRTGLMCFNYTHFW